MWSATRERLREALLWFPVALSAVGIVDREKGREAFDLAAPAMVTGGMRTLLRVADFFMMSIYAGGAAVAALELGFQYYFVPFGLALALTSGTISVVSRLKGAADHREANFAIKQSLWLALAVSVPITLFSFAYAEEMIAVLTNDDTTVALGGAYLRVVMYRRSRRLPRGRPKIRDFRDHENLRFSNDLTPGLKPTALVHKQESPSTFNLPTRTKMCLTTIYRDSPRRGWGVA